MKFGGFQELTLLDFPGEPAVLLFTSGCNFRCVYCHNWKIAWKITGADEKEIMERIERTGLKAVAITGGEPLFWPEMVDFIRNLKEKGYKVKLDTNGCFPDRVEALLDYVDYWAMDVKAPWSKYSELAGVQVDTERIQRSLRLIREGAKDYEFRTTAFSTLELEDYEIIGQQVEGAKYHVIQQFSPELAPVEWVRKLKPRDRAFLERAAEILRKYVKKVDIKNI